MTIPDVIGPRLRVLFCGINPGLYSEAIGHHFARPGNRFWRVLAEAGFTDGVLRPDDDRELLALGLGITNLVARASAQASELGTDELRVGARRLAAKAGRHRPGVLAFLGMGAYRTAFGRPRATIGLQPETIGATDIWLLPNPSGAQARYQLADMVEAFGALREHAGLEPAG